MKVGIFTLLVLLSSFFLSGCSPKALLSNSDIAFLNDLNRKVDDLNATVVKQQEIIDEMQLVIIELEKNKSADSNESK
jgi:hypothetical protein